ncbi:hypothetical protein LKD70_03825 [Ruminococcus sp. CLA-AA-H200]|uniref:Uncharacterized protein n=1 Tax=Ruminococcus turbiniformis TaxID=2881258 RepID=A0ABS8FW49_9FIRM|nr:hypothetical protein [Ruminococcus turbiniformis]MCC2253573.1 hypothetical protein [Ruminococcus turbiniformis]
MTLKLTAKEFLKQELEFFVDYRLEKGKLLYTLSGENKKETHQVNARFMYLSQKAELNRKEEDEICLLVKKGWLQYVRLYMEGYTAAAARKSFHCQVAGSLWGRNPHAVYFDSRIQDGPFVLQF